MNLHRHFIEQPKINKNFIDKRSNVSSGLGKG